MIDPQKITQYDSSLAELQEFLLFAICVAGKNANQQAAKLSQFLSLLPPADTPFKQIQSVSSVRPYLEKVRMGQYDRISRAYETLVNTDIDLRNADVSEFERIPGIGQKTSRFFILHSRPNARVACLDTHILKYMRDFMHINAPKSTPTSSKKYRELEVLFVEHCDLLGYNIAEYDLQLWTQYSGQNVPRLEKPQVSMLQ